MTKMLPISRVMVEKEDLRYCFDPIEPAKGPEYVLNKSIGVWPSRLALSIDDAMTFVTIW